MAATWEELASLAQGRAEVEEVADLILELNTDNQTKEILEGQRRYREQMATQYAAGRLDTQKEYEAIIADKDKTISELLAEIERLKKENK
jgi:hypothetical protein